MDTERFDHVWERLGQPPLMVSFELSEVEGYTICVGFSVRALADKPSAINSVVLRDLPFGKLLQRATRDRVDKVKSVRGHAHGSEGPSLERVAALYAQFCRAHSSRPRLEVAEALHMSKDTVAKQIQRCRKARLLAPTTRGRAGGLIHRPKTVPASAGMSASAAELKHVRESQEEEGSKP